MPSATLELAKYLRNCKVPFVGDLYINFKDVPNGYRLFTTSSNLSFLGWTTLVRITNGRWLVQWMRCGLTENPFTLAESHLSYGILNLLDRVVEENRASQVS